jgi:hypothetical protein
MLPNPNAQFLGRDDQIRQQIAKQFTECTLSGGFAWNRKMEFPACYALSPNRREINERTQQSFMLALGM